MTSLTSLVLEVLKGGHMAEEAKIEEKLVKAVKKAGGLCLKLVSPGYVGYLTASC